MKQEDADLLRRCVGLAKGVKSAHVRELSLDDYDRALSAIAEAERDAVRRLTDDQIEAVVSAAAVLEGECAASSAADLLVAFGCSDDEVERILRLCHDGRSHRAVPVLREAQAR